jgi:hypothetical protein
MNIAQIHKKLRSSYTHENLHKITTKIIDLHQNKQYDSIHEIMNVVAGFTKEKEEQYTKAFYKLMMIYHPDRITHHLAEIERHYAARDVEQLYRYSHIFPVIELEPSLVVRPSSDGPSADQYEWDAPADGFAYKDTGGAEMDDDAIDADDLASAAYDTDFFSVFKRIIYGHENIELPVHYLEDIDSLELSGYDISDLDGIRYCKQLVTIDLSNNSIVDLSELAYLDRLAELYISDNRICYIDGLGYLQHLRIVDLSNNAIDDVSQLFELERLEYVNIVGNRVPEAQIAALVRKGVMVIR